MFRRFSFVSQIIMSEIDELLASIEEEVFIPPPKVEDMIASLPVELREHVAHFYNWNWSLLPELNYRMDVAALVETPRPSLNELLNQLDWWIHLFNTEPTNPRLVGHGRGLLQYLRIEGLHAIADVFTEVINYNFG